MSIMWLLLAVVAVGVVRGDVTSFYGTIGDFAMIDARCVATFTGTVGGMERQYVVVAYYDDAFIKTYIFNDVTKKWTTSGLALLAAPTAAKFSSISIVVFGGFTWMAAALYVEKFTTNTEIMSKVYRRAPADTAWTSHLNFATKGAMDMELFVFGGTLYLAIANQFASTTASYDVASEVHKYSGAGTVWTLQDTIATKGASDWQSVDIGGTCYLLVANFKTTAGSIAQQYAVNSEVFKFNGANFVAHSTIATTGAKRWATASFGGNTYAIVTNHFDGTTYGLNSVVYKWDATGLGSFLSVQLIPTTGAWGVRTFDILSETYLAIAFYANSVGNVFLVNSKIFKWSTVTLKFELFQLIATRGCVHWTFWKRGSTYYLMPAESTDGTTSNLQSRILRFIDLSRTRSRSTLTLDPSTTMTPSISDDESVEPSPSSTRSTLSLSPSVSADDSQSVTGSSDHSMTPTVTPEIPSVTLSIHTPTISRSHDPTQIIDSRTESGSLDPSPWTMTLLITRSLSRTDSLTGEHSITMTISEDIRSLTQSNTDTEEASKSESPSNSESEELNTPTPTFSSDRSRTNTLSLDIPSFTPSFSNTDRPIKSISLSKSFDPSDTASIHTEFPSVTFSERSLSESLDPTVDDTAASLTETHKKGTMSTSLSRSISDTITDLKTRTMTQDRTWPLTKSKSQTGTPSASDEDRHNKASQPTGTRNIKESPTVTLSLSPYTRTKRTPSRIFNVTPTRTLSVSESSSDSILPIQSTLTISGSDVDSGSLSDPLSRPRPETQLYLSVDTWDPAAVPALLESLHPIIITQGPKGEKVGFNKAKQVLLRTSVVTITDGGHLISILWGIDRSILIEKRELVVFGIIALATTNRTQPKFKNDITLTFLPVEKAPLGVDTAAFVGQVGAIAGVLIANAPALANMQAFAIIVALPCMTPVVRRLNRAFIITLSPLYYLFGPMDNVGPDEVSYVSIAGWNIVLVTVIGLLNYALARYMYLETKAKGDWVHCAAMARFPNFTIVVAYALLPATLQACFRSFMFSKNSGVLFGMSVFFIGYTSGTLIHGLWWIFYHDAQWCPYAMDLASDIPAAIGPESAKGVDVHWMMLHWVLPRGQWLPQRMVRRYGVLFGTYRGGMRGFHVVESFFIVALALGSSFVPGTSYGCDVQMWCIAILLGLMGILCTLLLVMRSVLRSVLRGAIFFVEVLIVLINELKLDDAVHLTQGSLSIVMGILMLIDGGVHLYCLYWENTVHPFEAMVNPGETQMFSIGEKLSTMPRDVQQTLITDNPVEVPPWAPPPPPDMPNLHQSGMAAVSWNSKSHIFPDVPSPALPPSNIPKPRTSRAPAAAFAFLNELSQQKQYGQTPAMDREMRAFPPAPKTKRGADFELLKSVL